MNHDPRRKAAASHIARVFYVSILLLSGIAGGTRGQGVHGGITYQPAWPLGSTDDFVHEFSWRGIGIDIRRFTNDYITVGLALGWNEFIAETDSIVSAQRRSINLFPVLLNLSLYTGLPGHLRLFVGGNAGIYVLQQRLDDGLAPISETNVHVGLASEAGCILPLGSNMNGVLQTRYNYAFPAGSVRGQSYLTYSIGLAWVRTP